MMDLLERATQALWGTEVPEETLPRLMVSTVEAVLPSNPSEKLKMIDPSFESLRPHSPD
jgi:hypothetical protein